MKKENIAIHSTMLIPFAVGGVQAALTLGVQKLSVISGNSVLGNMQEFLMTLLMPGMFGAMFLADNVHAWNLCVAAVVNGLLYFGAAWGVLLLGNRLMRRAREKGVS
jgi:hypothetical protein